MFEICMPNYSVASSFVSNLDHNVKEFTLEKLSRVHLQAHLKKSVL